MLISIYIALLVVALFLILLGYFIDIKVLSIVGAFAVFLLGLVMSQGAITYQTGQNESYSYICSICGTPSVNVTDCFGNPTPCVEHASIGICYLYDGCFYNETAEECQGEPSDCDTYLTGYDCELNGCNFTSTVINGTAGINASVIDKKVTTYNYTVLNDGASGWFGRYLALAGGFAMILMFITNKKKDERY
jgi:hypothetical protein